MKITIRLAALLLAFGVPVGTTAAQQPTQAQRDAIRQSCRSDYETNCASVPAGGAASLQCLQSNLSKLSPACQSAVSAATQSGAPAQPATAASKPPPLTQSAPAAPRQPPTMSPRQEAMRMRMACGADFRAYCPGVPFGGGRALDCLAANDTLLSQSCRGALSEVRAGQ